MYTEHEMVKLGHVYKLHFDLRGPKPSPLKSHFSAAPKGARRRTKGAGPLHRNSSTAGQ